MTAAPGTPQNALMTSSRRIANVPRSSTFRSLVNFVSSPFHRRKEQPETARDDSRSRSGSVDNWDGQPPTDVFSLAGAAAPAVQGDESMEEEVHVHFPPPSQRSLPPPPRSQTPVAAPTSARAMLTRFLQAKAGAPMTEEDMRSFELLTQRVAEEDAAPSSAPAPFVFGTRGERAESTAFSFSSTNVMPSRTLARSQTTNNLSASTSKPSARRPTYLGPGMSSRRKPVPTSTRPFTTPSLPGDKRKAEDESEQPEKKRRTEVIEERGLSASKSMPDLGHLRALGQPDKDKAAPTKLQLQQSKLRESFAAPPSPAPRSETEVESLAASSTTSISAAAVAAKKRTADIMLDIIDSSKTPIPEPPKKEIVNPYQGSGLSVSTTHRSALMRSTRRPATPKRKTASSNGSSTTPLGKTPTPLERIESASRAEAQPSPSKKIRSLARAHAETPSKSSTSDPFQEPAPAPVGAPAPAPAPPVKVKTPEPVIESTPAPAVSVSEPTKATSFTNNAVASSSSKPIEAFQNLSKIVPVEKPTFKAPTPVRQPSPSPEPLAASPTPGFNSKAPAKQTARDIALAVPELALPFVTFVVSFPSPTPSASRAAALKASQADLPSFSWSTKAKGKGKAIAGAPEWKCNVCDCKSPDSAAKCVVCESDRPAAAPKAAAPQAFNWAAAGMAPKTVSGDQITCDGCTLKIPSDVAKCPHCDTPQTSSKVAAPATTAKPSVAPAPQGFNWGAAGLKSQRVPDDKWKCSTCSTLSPLDTAKCIACEEPKPATKTADPPAPAQAAPESATPAPQAFNWGAAGAKPTAASGWTCSTCMVNNPMNVSNCVACEMPK